MRFYKAVASNGRVYARSTGRVYTHAVVEPDAKYRAGSWAGRPDLARKLAYPGSETLEAVEIDAREYRAILKANKEAGR